MEGARETDLPRGAGRLPGDVLRLAPAARLGDSYSLDLHEDRAGTDGLASFYRALASDDAQLTGQRPVGLLWAEKTFRFDNTDLVLLLSAYPGGRALNGTGYIALSTLSGNVYIPVEPVPGRTRSS